MASLSQGAVARPLSAMTGRNGLLDRYFYFAMSLLVAVITMYGFSRTVNANLFHPPKPRPVLLWIHGAAFSGWVALFIVQSTLIRTRNIRLHRSLGGLGAALGAFMVPLGIAVAVIMDRFHIHQLHEAAAGYAPTISQYLNAWWDWHTSHATTLNGTTAQYLQKTDGTLNTMHELLEVVASPNVDAVLPATENSPSPYLANLAGRLVVDIWDQGFSGIQQNLASLGDYGITNCVVIIHNWQYAGYDNELPQHYPANPSLGGGGALQAAIAQAQRPNCLPPSTHTSQGTIKYLHRRPTCSTSPRTSSHSPPSATTPSK